MTTLDAVRLPQLMALTIGSSDVIIALVDGPVLSARPSRGASALVPSAPLPAACTCPESPACVHGTSVAAILCRSPDGQRRSICPGCTLLVHPIFPESPGSSEVPSATPAELAIAIMEAIDAGARLINISAALRRPSRGGERLLEEALDYSAQRGALVVAAAGNQNAMGATPLTRHPNVIPAVASDTSGRPSSDCALSRSIGWRGLAVPVEHVNDLGVGSPGTAFSGTSAAAPFVTGSLALLMSLFPDTPLAEVRHAVTQPLGPRARRVAPPLLDAWAAYNILALTQSRN